MKGGADKPIFEFPLESEKAELHDEAHRDNIDHSHSIKGMDGSEDVFNHFSKHASPAQSGGKYRKKRRHSNKKSKKRRRSSKKSKRKRRTRKK